MLPKIRGYAKGKQTNLAQKRCRKILNQNQHLSQKKKIITLTNWAEWFFLQNTILKEAIVVKTVVDTAHTAIKNDKPLRESLC